LTFVLIFIVFLSGMYFDRRFNCKWITVNSFNQTLELPYFQIDVYCQQNTSEELKMPKINHTQTENERDRNLWEQSV